MILEEIVNSKKREIKNLKQKKHSLQHTLAENELTLIAEIKKASPSKGVIAENFDPCTRLHQYLEGGADAVSVLTDSEYFQGSNDIFREIRMQTELPLLRKEFIIDFLQVYESCLLGADVILLIAAILDKNQITDMINLARQLGMEAIVEVHTRQELEKVMSTPAEIIGINNRNLHDFSVSLTTTKALIQLLKDKNLRSQYYIISESGIKDNEDISYLTALGVDGVLVGESLMKADKPAQTINEFKEAGQVYIRS